jgi:nucleoside-diphosphate-sugar epimerase
MTVLVTGASGFLGGALTRALVEKGEDVRILVRTTSDLRHLADLPIDLALGDLEDQASLRRAVHGVRIVYHCAGLATDWAPWESFYRANVTGVRNLLEAVQDVSKLERFLHISTSDVYGYPRQACDESHPITPINLPYARSKSLGETAVWEWESNTGLPVTVIRPVSIYGPRSKDFVTEIATLMLKRQMVLLDGGDCRAGLLYVDNAADGIIQAAESPHTVGEAYNLRDETDETWGHYTKALAEGLGTGLPWIRLSGRVALGLAAASEAVYRVLRVKSRPLLTRHAVYVFIRDQGYSIEKAQRDFGFRSRVSFREGVRRSLDWFLSESCLAAD